MQEILGRTATTRLVFTVSGVIAIATLAHCSERQAPSSHRDSPSPPAVASEEARARVLDIRARFPAAVSPPVANLERAPSGGVRLIARPQDKVHVELPAEASGDVRISDAGSDVAVAFALEGASATAIAVVDGYAIYPGAARSGGDVLHRPSPLGTEDFVFFAQKPDAEHLRYRADVSRVAGLRLVENTLEMLDATGTPRLRVAPPVVVDATGRAVHVALSLEGCAADRSTRPPWGRPVTPPGSTVCDVVVSWFNRGVRYPALVDPKWETTQNMVVKRAFHAMAVLDIDWSPSVHANVVLVTGGFDASGLDPNASPLKLAELYNPLTRTFTPTVSMYGGRAAHTATPIKTDNGWCVLIAGGADKLLNINPPEQLKIINPINVLGTEIFSCEPNECHFTPGPLLSKARYHHSATPLDQGRVLVAGGIDDTNSPTNSANVLVVDPSQSPPGSPTLMFMQQARYGHAAALLKNGSVLITGGIGSAGISLPSSDVFCPSPVCGQDMFLPLSPSLQTTGRAFHTATTLSNGDVLVAGGIKVTPSSKDYLDTANLFVSTGDPMNPGAFQLQPIPMMAPRAFHTATLLDPPLLLGDGSAEVILAGGFGGAQNLSSVQAYLPATKAFSSLPAMATGRRHAAAALVNAGQSTVAGRGVLVTGGLSGVPPAVGPLPALESAELLLKPDADPCQTDGECLSGHCSDGVCCNEACDKECDSCTAALKQDQSPDGTCGPTKEGTALPVACHVDLQGNHIVIHPTCDGKGAVQIGSDTQSCGPGVCKGGQCQFECDGDSLCGASGWCGPSDGGATGTCQNKISNGAPCTSPDQCQSGHCIDGVCCNEACTEQCRACDLPGHVGICQPLGTKAEPADPHSAGDGGAREPCAGTGTPCGGHCVGIIEGDAGSDSDKCQYPGDSQDFKEPTCSDEDGGPSKLSRYRCDGHGSYDKKEEDCQGFRCAGENQCKTSCSTDLDCASGLACIVDPDGKRQCRPFKDGEWCNGIDTLRRPKDPRGDLVCPNHFACPLRHVACLERCESVLDCAGGYVCNGQHQCIPRPPVPPLVSSCACATAGATGDARTASPWGALLLGLFAIRRLRRRP